MKVPLPGPSSPSKSGPCLETSAVFMGNDLEVGWGAYAGGDGGQAETDCWVWMRGVHNYDTCSIPCFGGLLSLLLTTIQEVTCYSVRSGRRLPIVSC